MRELVSVLAKSNHVVCVRMGRVQTQRQQRDITDQNGTKVTRMPHHDFISLQTPFGHTSTMNVLFCHVRAMELELWTGLCENCFRFCLTYAFYVRYQQQNEDEHVIQHITS